MIAFKFETKISIGLWQNQSIFAMSSVDDSCVIEVLRILIMTLLSFMNKQLDSQLRYTTDYEPWNLWRVNLLL